MVVTTSGICTAPVLLDVCSSQSEGLLESDDKLSIGTIRRYGLAADFMIMVGGAKTELDGDEDGVVNGKEVRRFLELAAGSIDEIATILRNARVIPKLE